MKLEDHIAKDAAGDQKLGTVWVPPTDLGGLTIRVAGTDNALLVEVNGETWSLPDAYRLDKFR